MQRLLLRAAPALLSLAACAAPRAAAPLDLPAPLPSARLEALALGSPAASALQEDPRLARPRGAAARVLPIRAGVEVQAYPAGVVTALHVQLPLSDTEQVTLRAGWNATDRGDFGEHDDEEGGGPGLGIGYRRYFGREQTGWLLGCRVDLWDLEIDWKEDGGREGTTDVRVLQPTLEAGRAFRLGERWRLEATLAVGAELNVDTDGEDVGEGAIGLVGLTLTRSF